MIGGVTGRIHRAEPGEVLVETTSGLWMNVLVPVSCYAQLSEGNDALLYTVMRVRDDSCQLFGFLSLRERKLFLQLISVSGIGGKIALALISAFSPEEVVQIIEDGDFNRLSTVPGIGKKTAQRVVLELTGKLKLTHEPGEGGKGVLSDELISGLVNLGFTPRHAREAVDSVMGEKLKTSEFEPLFKRALKRISRK